MKSKRPEAESQTCLTGFFWLSGIATRFIFLQMSEWTISLLVFTPSAEFALTGMPENAIWLVA
jgi:hypothetical protein